MTIRGQQVFVKFGKFSGLGEALDAFQARQIERRERCLAAGLSFEDICAKAGKPSAIGLERYEELWERIYRDSTELSPHFPFHGRRPAVGDHLRGVDDHRAGL